MPLKPSRGLRKCGYTGHLNEWQRYYLLQGDSGLDPYPFENLEEEKKAWKQNRDKLLAEYIIAHPGFRPAAFWRFDNKMNLEKVGDSSWPDSHGRWHIIPEYETSFEFLKRNNLLLTGEQAPAWLETDFKMRENRIKAHQERLKTYTFYDEN